MYHPITTASGAFAPLTIVFGRGINATGHCGLDTRVVRLQHGLLDEELRAQSLQSGVTRCLRCTGRGSKAIRMRVFPMLPEICRSCGATGITDLFLVYT
jgi:hypothetical protein